MNKQMMWVFVIVALIVGAFGGYIYEKSKLTDQMMMSESNLQQQVTDLKMKNDHLMKVQSTENEMMMQKSPKPSGMMLHTTTAPTGAMMEK